MNKWTASARLGDQSRKLLAKVLLASLSIVSVFGRSAAAEGIASAATGGSWPGFRGPGGIGHATNANPPLTWNVETGKNILWKIEVPTPGMSSPVVWGDRVFLTGADDTQRLIYCYHADTGALLWQHDAKDIPGSPDHDKLPRVMAETGFAAPTTTTDGRFVAAIFATGDLVCTTMSGERVWARNLGVPKNHYGHASSLISGGDRLFVQYDQTEGSKLLALDFATGKLAWQADRGVISWSSPLLVENKGRTELILSNCKTIDGYNPTNGNLLWHVEYSTGELAPSAAYADGVVYVANDHAAAVALDIGDHQSQPKILWSWDKVLPDASSPLADIGLVIIPSGFGAVACLDGRSGNVLWEHDFDVGFYSSPILVGDQVHITDVSGEMQVFKLAKEFELIGTARLGEDVYATPAFVGGRIYVRGLLHLFCIAEQN